MGILIIISIIFIFILIILNTNYYCNNQLSTNNLCFELKQNNNLKYLDGYWISNPNFNDISDIDNMILYIDYDKLVGYLLIIVNNKVISKDELTIYIDENCEEQNNNFIINYKCRFNNKNDFIWNKLEFNCILNILTGNLKLFNNNILYADLFKDNVLSYYINSIN